MDLGLGNLDTLKTGILPLGAGETTDAQFDPLLVQIGKSTSAMFEKYCGRKWSRVVNATEDFSAQNLVLFLERYPIESVASISQRDLYSNTFVNNGTAQIIGLNEGAGMIQLGYLASNLPATLRVTFTGGHYYETLEPLTNGTATVGYGTSGPAGSYSLPNDLVGAWILQCQADFEYRQKLGVGVLRDSGTRIADLGIIPEVRSIIHQHIRRGP